MKVNFKEVADKVLSNKKLGMGLKIAGLVAGGVSTVILAAVDKKETDAKLEKLVNEKLAGK